MPRKNVGFVKPPEPSFITRMKQQIGYKEGPTIDTKREPLEAATSEDLDDRLDDDEAPVVVVLNKGDLSEQEAEREMALVRSSEKKTETEKSEETGGRLLFRKPVKRNANEDEAGSLSSNKTSAKPSNKETKEKSTKRLKQNTKLLSFHQDDEEEEED